MILRRLWIDLFPFMTGAVPIVVLFIFLWWDRKRRHQRIQAPQAEKLLRPPGHSLSINLDDTIDRAITKLLVAFGLCAIAGPFLDSSARMPGIWATFFALTGLAFGAGGAYATVRVVRDLGQARNLRLGLRGEQAVAEALQEVGDCGYRAFHDFPGGENWNIDHVTVGPAGVFLIETKARNRVRSRNTQPAHVVHVFGNRLQFPTGRDLKSIPQAERNAKWLAGYLTKKTGEKVDVMAVVVLPGWYWENKELPANGTMVMNADYLKKYLRGRRAQLPEAQVRRIIAALDEKCRDVEF